LTYKHWQKSS